MKKWKKPIKIISIVCICLCLALLAGCFVNNFVDFEELEFSDKVTSDKVRNEQNLLDPEFYKTIALGDQKGVTVTTNSDGSITLDGEATGTSHIRIFSILDTKVKGLTLTIGAVDFGEDAENSCLYWRHHKGADERFSYYLYSGESETITLSYSDGSNYNLYLAIEEGDKFDNVTIYPVLNYGVTAVSYFV